MKTILFTFRKIFISLDLLLALAVTVIIAIFFPDEIYYSAAKDIFEVSVSVLSIVFSIYFMALTVLITSGDNEFINFVEENGLFSKIIGTFKITLFILFLSLMLSIILYVSVLNHGDYYSEKLLFPHGWLVIFAFWGSYSLFSTLQSIYDAIRFAEYRVRFFEITRDKFESKD